MRVKNLGIGSKWDASEQLRAKCAVIGDMHMQYGVDRADDRGVEIRASMVRTNGWAGNSGARGEMLWHMTQAKSHNRVFGF